MKSESGIRIIAGIEAVKGVVVLLMGGGFLALIHRDVQSIAESLVELTGFDPDGRYPRIFLHAASTLTDSRLWLLAGCALAYSIVRFIEAYGLWENRRWAEWFAIISGAIYVPIEVYALAEGFNWPKIVALIGNLAIVAYLSLALVQRKNKALL